MNNQFDDAVTIFRKFIRERIWLFVFGAVFWFIGTSPMIEDLLKRFPHEKELFIQQQTRLLFSEQDLLGSYSQNGNFGSNRLAYLVFPKRIYSDTDLNMLKNNLAQNGWRYLFSQEYESTGKYAVSVYCKQEVMFVIVPPVNNPEQEKAQFLVPDSLYYRFGFFYNQDSREGCRKLTSS